MRLFVWEELCCDAGTGSDLVSASLRAEGEAMLAAVLADAAGVAGLEVVVGLPAASTPPGTFALVIAPEFDGILERRCRQALTAGARLLGPSPEAIALCADKLLLARHLHAAGVPTPWPTLSAGSAVPWQGPAVFKHRWGAGSLGLGLGFPPDDSMPRVVQPFIRGTPASVACLCGPAGLEPLLPCEQHLGPDFAYLGGASPLATPLGIRAADLAMRALAAVPGLCGYVGVDVILGDGPAGDVVVEINPRLTTSYVGLRALAVDNLVAAMLRVAEGRPAGVNWRAGRAEWRIGPGGITVRLNRPAGG